MTAGFSRYLDLLRMIATFVVLASHFAYTRFTRGDYLFIREWNIGSDAVILFFVISGYVVAYTAHEKDKTLGAFAFARASRLYSVVIPAIGLTLVFDHLGSHIDPEAYRGWWWNPAPAWEVILRTASFSTEWTANTFRPGTNGPFWSLSYEAAYYALFGIAMFLRGWWRALLLASFLALVGIKVLILMPAWLCGVWLYHHADSLSLRIVPALIGFIGPIALYAAALSISLPDHLMVLTKAAIGESAVSALRFSNEFIWNALIGILVTVHLMAARTLFKRRSRQASSVSIVSLLAGASFSIYLVHYPALQFWHAILPDALTPVLRDALLLGVTLLTCLLFAAAFERQLPQIRKAIREVMGFIEKRLTFMQAISHGRSCSSGSDRRHAANGSKLATRRP